MAGGGSGDEGHPAHGSRPGSPADLTDLDRSDAVTNKETLEELIGQWRQYLKRRQAVHSADVEELEDHLLPFKSGSYTEVLAAIHFPIALWLMVFYAYAGGRWRHHEQRMNYMRFSGEWFIYYTLIALGGGTLMGLTAFIFNAIGLNAERALQGWVLP